MISHVAIRRCSPPRARAGASYHDCPAGAADQAVRLLRPQGTTPMRETTPLTAWPDGPADELLDAAAAHGLVPGR